MPGTALVLSGGGAKGAFQVGAEKYLREERGFTWDIIAGVSVGSLNATMLAMEKYARLEEIWRNASNDQIYTGKLNVWALIKMVFGRKSALGNEPLRKLIESEWSPGLVTKDLRVGAVSLRTGRYEEFKAERPDFASAVLASTAMPIYWKPVQMPPDYLDMVDGGLRNISPLGDVIKTDPDRIVIINCTPDDPDPQDEFPGALQIGTRSLEIALNEILLNDVREFVRINRLVEEAKVGGVTLHHEDGRAFKSFESVIIKPSGSLGDTLDFSTGAILRRLDAGREAARKAVP